MFRCSRAPPNRITLTQRNTTGAHFLWSSRESLHHLPNGVLALFKSYRKSTRILLPVSSSQVRSRPESRTLDYGMRLACLPSRFLRASYTPLLLPRTLCSARHLVDSRPRSSFQRILLSLGRLLPPLLFAPARIFLLVPRLQTVRDSRHELAERRARRVWFLYDVSG